MRYFYSLSRTVSDLIFNSSFHLWETPLYFWIATWNLKAITIVGMIVWLSGHETEKDVQQETVAEMQAFWVALGQHRNN